MTIIGIVAMTPSGVIGKDNDLPWPRLPEDMRFFRETTTGHAVVMGWNTWLSIGSKPLPNRLNIVVSTQEREVPEGVRLVRSFEEAVGAAALEGQSSLFVIGGAKLYESSIARMDELYVTWVNQEHEGDVAFPKWWRQHFRDKAHPVKETADFEIRRYSSR